jgi:hypothetical protein
MEDYATKAPDTILTKLYIVHLYSTGMCSQFSVNVSSFIQSTILYRSCNLTAFIHSSTGLVVHPFASRHEGPEFNPHGGT